MDREIIINACYGGYSLSPIAVRKLAIKKGKNCYFFIYDLDKKIYYRVCIKDLIIRKYFPWFAFSVNNPNDYKLNQADTDGLYKEANKRADEIYLDDRPSDRSDPDLLAVVKKLGRKANGRFAKLKIVNIPDDVKFEIEDDDGFEHIAEIHRVWY